MFPRLWTYASEDVRANEKPQVQRRSHSDADPGHKSVVAGLGGRSRRMADEIVDLAGNAFLAIEPLELVQRCLAALPVERFEQIQGGQHPG